VPSFQAMTHLWISDFDAQVRSSRLDQMATPTADVSLGGRKITGLANPTAADHAATMGFVISVAAGQRWKDPVRAATTVNGADATAFEDGDVIDGVTLATGDRILRKNQTDQTKNGIFVVQASGAPVRAIDADDDAELPAATLIVLEGTVNAGTQWTCNNPTVTLGTTNITFVQSNAGATTYAGDETTIHLASNTFNVIDNSITYAKEQMIATKTLVGRNTAGTGNREAVTATQVLDWVGTPARGNLLTRAASSWAQLVPGAARRQLVSAGAGNDLVYGWGGPEFHVDDYGADPTGVADSAIAINAARAAAEAAGGGVVKFRGGGTYKINSYVTWSSPCIWFVGEGNGARILCTFAAGNIFESNIATPATPGPGPAACGGAGSCGCTSTAPSTAPAGRRSTPGTRRAW
jgi:hypothetical protein